MGNLGCVLTMDSSGRTIWIVDAHRDYEKRFVVRSDEKLTACVELLSVTCDALPRRRRSRYGRGAGVGRGRGVGEGLGVGVGVGVRSRTTLYISTRLSGLRPQP